MRPRAGAPEAQSRGGREAGGWGIGLSPPPREEVLSVNEKTKGWTLFTVKFFGRLFTLRREVLRRLVFAVVGVPLGLCVVAGLVIQSSA